jgi:predicted Zn-dependent protease
MERELTSSKLLVRDPEANAYLRRVLCRVVGDDRCHAVRIYLLREPGFNASMAPNGMMIVNTGLLLRTRDEAELAAILGHEFTHFEYRHTLADHKSLRNSAGWAAWLSAVAFAAGSPVAIGPEFLAFHFSFSRDQEREADIVGLQMMSASGYRPASASEVWAQMRQEQDAKAAALGVRSLKDRDRGLFASHPMSVERMAYLQEAAKKVTASGEHIGVDEYRKGFAGIWPMLVEDQIKLNDFGTSEFLLRNLARDDWTGQLLYARGELYRFRGKTGDFEQAAALYRQAIAKPDAPAAAWRGLGLALARTGDNAGAKTAIDEYLKQNPAAPDKTMLAMIGAP